MEIKLLPYEKSPLLWNFYWLNCSKGRIFAHNKIVGMFFIVYLSH
jgi:hypothetical protein